MTCICFYFKCLLENFKVHIFYAFLLGSIAGELREYPQVSPYHEGASWNPPPGLCRWMSFLTSQQALPIGCISAGPRVASVRYQKPARLTRLGPKSPQRSRHDQ